MWEPVFKSAVPSIDLDEVTKRPEKLPGTMPKATVKDGLRSIGQRHFHSLNHFKGLIGRGFTATGLVPVVERLTTTVDLGHP